MYDTLSHAGHVYDMGCSRKPSKFKGLVILTTKTMKMLNYDFFKIYIPQNFVFTYMKRRTYPMVSTNAVNECVWVCVWVCRWVGGGV